ncbi:MAG: hypothetical protein WDZ30_06795, partial [Cellvibrionaceae bacterium]
TAQGERIVAESRLRSDIIFFNTIIPEVVKCGRGGTGWLMAMEYDTGLPPSATADASSRESEAPFDFNNDGVIDDDDKGYVGKERDPVIGAPNPIGDVTIDVDTEGDPVKEDTNFGTNFAQGRLGWQEMIRR